jgi:predicted transcriptional regulator
MEDGRIRRIMASEVISMYFAAKSSEHKHIRAGLAELEAGQGISNERVTEWLASWGTENELPAPSKPRRRKTLDELLEGIPEDATMEEIDWGRRVEMRFGKPAVPSEAR